MSYLLSSLKNAENQRKQNLCPNTSTPSELSKNVSETSSSDTTNQATSETRASSENDLFLENSSNQFSTKKNSTRTFLLLSIISVVIAYTIWLYMSKNETQPAPLAPITSEDKLQLKLDTALQIPTSTDKQDQAQKNPSKNEQ